jgi:Tfp pilus assembly protein FimT
MTRPAVSPSARAAGLRHRRAVSMLEMVTTLVIVAITAAIVIPRFGNANARYAADLAARKLAEDLEHARRSARQTGAPRSVRFNLANHSYTVDGSGSGILAGYAVRLTGDPYRATISAASFADTTTTVTFNAFGLPTPTGDSVITLRAGSQTRLVRVNGSAGTVSWN